MKSPKNKHLIILHIFFTAVIFFAVFSIFVQSSFFNDDNTKVPIDNVTPFYDGWNTVSNGKTSTVKSGDTIASEHGKFTLTNKLPKNIEKNTYLFFISSGDPVEVAIDGKTVYSYAANNSSANKFCGNIICFIDLYNRGENISVTFSSHFKHNTVPKFTIGSQGAIIKWILTKNISVIVYVIIMTLICILVFLLFFVQHFFHKLKNNNYILFFGIFILTSTIWVLTDSPLLQLMVSNSIVPALISFYSFMLMPIFFLLFIKNICSLNNKGFIVFCYLYIVNFIILNTLHLLNIADLRQTLMSTHLLIIFSYAYTLKTIIAERNKNKTSILTNILFSISAFGIFTLIALIRFYLVKQSTNNSLLFQISIAVFIILLICIAIKQSVVLLEENARSQMYKKLAFIDSMTGLGNRAAFEQFIAQCESDLSPDDTVSVISIDLNNLKEINDTFGHAAGDELINATAGCMLQTFNTSKKCFRIGGDEFIVIFSYTCSVFDEAKRLNHAIEQYNLHAAHPISVSYGCACAKLSETNGIHDICKEADSKMYYNKMQFHKTRGDNKYN